MATSTASTNQDRLLRLKDIIPARVPVSRSRWYMGIKEGVFPKPVRLGPATVAWRESDINKLIAELTAGK